jgi:hypothetical protein
MQLKDLPDWSKRLGSLEQSDRVVLTSAESSSLGHFAILVIESDGVRNVVLLEVGSSKVAKVLTVLNAHVGQPLHEIALLEIID